MKQFLTILIIIIFIAGASLKQATPCDRKPRLEYKYFKKGKVIKTIWAAESVFKAGPISVDGRVIDNDSFKVKPY